MSATNEPRDIIEVIKTTVSEVLKRRNFYTVRFDLHKPELEELRQHFKIKKTDQGYEFRKR